MSKRDSLLLVDDIIQSFKKIKSYTQGLTFDDFLKSDITIDAVVRNFEIAGEASNYISDDFKLLHPEINWRIITDFRNKLIHHYFGVNHSFVWNAVQQDIDPILTFLEVVIADNL